MTGNTINQKKTSFAENRKEYIYIISKFGILHQTPMRKLYKIVFLFVLVSFSSTLAHSTNKAAESTIAASPSGQITGNATVCLNATAPLITFEVKDDNGKEPYKFTYTINGGTPINVSTTGNNKSITVPALTNATGTFTYILTDVTDKDNNSVTVSSANTVLITVIPNFTVSAGNDILVCKGNTISLSATPSGNGPNTVSYSWSGPNGFTSSQQSPSITNSTTAMSGNYTVTASIGNCSVQDVVRVDVAEPQITSPQFQNGILVECVNAGGLTGDIGFFLSVPTYSASILNYSVDWENDGIYDAIFTASNWSSIILRSFSVGAHTISIKMNLTNGCSASKPYSVFVGSSPSPATLQLLPNQSNGCSPHTTQWYLNIPKSNVTGTIYTAQWGDNTGFTYTQGNTPPSNWMISDDSATSITYLITKVYTLTSCGKNVIVGGVTYNNVYQPTVVTQNPCSTTPQPSGTGIVSVSEEPTASFTPNPLPAKICIGQALQLNNTSNFGFTIPLSNGATCSNTAPFYWTISPSTAGSWTATGLGSDNGSSNQLFWTTGSMTPSITFNVAGTYTITLRVKNSCGDSTTLPVTICIEAPPVPTFTLNNTVGCTPQSITTTNTTVATNSCTPPTYVWSVAYAPSNCGTSIPAIPNQTTPNASYNFTEPGTYTITLSATNSCGSFPISQTVTVKKPPTISSINGLLANYCGPTNINPTAIVNSCAPASSTLTYSWNFPGGIPTTSNLVNPGPISYATAGNYTVSLLVSNECGDSVMVSKSFTINDTPVLTNTPLNQTICSGSTTALVNLTSSPTGATFSWTATATAGISGFTPSGTNTIPVQTISTTNTNSGTVTYAITPSLGGCPGAITNYIITVNPAPTITPLISSTVCIGGTPNVLSFTISGATGTPTYQWYSNTANNTTTGTAISGEINTTYNPPSTAIGTLYYYCIITLPTGGCSNIKTNTATVVINPLPTIITPPIATQNLCVGGAIPSPLSVTATGGTGTLGYQWYFNTTNSTTGATPVGSNLPTYTPPTFNAIGTFYYYVVVSATGSGCGTVTSPYSEVVVVADPSISVQPLVTQTQCQNSVAIPLNVSATDGIGTFSYQWYKTSTLTNTGGNPVGTNSSTYLPPTDVVGTFYYYCLVSQTGLGCSVKSNVATVVVVNAPQITTHPQSAAVCAGTPITPLTVAFSNGTGTATYQWYDDNGLIIGAISDTYTPTTTVTTNYYCIITFSSGGCTSITSNKALITINPQPTIIAQPLATQNLCVGGTISTPLSVTPAGGTGTPSYQWYSTTNNSATGGIPITGTNSSTYTPPALTIAQTYNYYVVITYSEGGCSSVTSDLAQVIVVNDPTVTKQPLVSQTLCQGATPTNLTIIASGGIGTYSYQWYSSATNSNTVGIVIAGETNNSFTPPTTSVGTTYYYCVITQAGIGCNVTSATAEVIVNLAPTIITQPQSSSVCLGQTPTLLSVSYTNGVGTPTYQWYSNTANSTSGSSPISGATNATFNPQNTVVGTTYYYCIITLPTGGCSSLTSTIATVTINPNPVIANKTALICSGNPFTISPLNSGSEIVAVGTTYTWTNPTIFPAGSVTGASAQSTPQSNISQNLINTTISPAIATYTVTPLSGFCIGTNFTIAVTVNPAISPNVTATNSACFSSNSGAIQTNITGGIPFSSGAPYQISWTGPNGFTSAASSISNLAPGNYALSITDAGGCPINEKYLITEPDDIVLTTVLEKDITCFNDANGAIDITISGGTLNYTFSWTKDGIPFATTEDLINLSPGEYVITVSDANNCGPKTATFTITEPPILAVNLVNKTNILCFGDATGVITVNVVGGTLPYTYAWSGPNSFTNSNQNLTAVFAGTYDLIVTDNSGCVKNLTVQLTQTHEIKITATTTPIICYGSNDASISIVISGGITPYQIVWSNLGGGTFQNNLSAGDYLITVTDALNCVQTLNINIPEAPIFTINPVVKNITCFGDKNGSINLNLVGGIAPVKLVWDDSAVAGTTRNNLGPGPYTVTIIDGKPCTIKRTFIILEPQLLVLQGNVTNALDCDNANTGAINLLVSGGSAPFTYSWSNGATTEDLVNISAGNYLVTVKDTNGCTKQAQYSINRPPPIVIAVDTKTDFDCETKFVKQTFVASVSGGVPPYQLVWSSGTVSGLNNEFMNTSQNGTVILNVTDAIGCKSNYTFTVNTPTLGSPSFNVSSFAYTTYGNYSINDPIQFTNTSTGDYESMIWDFGDGTFSTELNPVHTFINPKDYVVTQTVTYPFGCVFVQKITLIIGKGYVLVVPTAFTPNNDTLNDTFRPVTKGLKNIRLDIYDTWGSMIYSESGENLRGWDGKIKDSNAENGNYYCKVSGETFYGTIVNENHPFVLIK